MTAQSSREPVQGRGLRQRLSGFVNRQLSRLGYSIIRNDGSRNAPYFAAHEGLRFAYEPIIIHDALAPWATDDAFLALWKAVRPYTLVDIYRCFELYEAVREVAPIHGDIVEVGVWRGGSGCVLASAAARWKPDSIVWLCDTFAGVVKAGQFDPNYQGGEHADTSKRSVEDLLSSQNITNANVLEGVFPDDTSPQLASRSIALLHVDVDAYQSALDIVTWAERRMPSGSLLIFDDYGFSSCKGITRLVNELRESRRWIWFYNLNKHALLVKR